MAENSTVKLVYKKLLIVIFLVGCATHRDPYLLSKVPAIRLLEKQDHKLCTSLKLNFDQKDNFLNRAYWHCRLSFAKYRLSTGRAQTKRDKDIQDLVTKISLKISATPESVIIRENKKMDNRDHNKCLVMGFELDTEDRTKIEDYFACRKVLIDEKQVVPPYGNLDYLPYRNDSYSIGFVIDQRIYKAIDRYNGLKKEYPTCIQYNTYGLNFKRCKSAQNKSRQCLKEVRGKIFRQEGEEKVKCQKMAYIRFGDSLLKGDEKRKREIAQKNKSSDFYNNQSFASLGIDGTDFFSKDEDDGWLKETPEEINSQDGLYEKFELTKLRRKFIAACQVEANVRIGDFHDGLKKECEDLTKFEIVGEYGL